MKDQLFEHPQDVKYTLTTGSVFKPFFCFSDAAAMTKFTSNPPTMTFNFVQKNSSGTFNIPSSVLPASAHTSLGIYVGTPYSTIAT